MLECFNVKLECFPRCNHCTLIVFRFCVVFFCFRLFMVLLLDCKMLLESLVHIGFVDGTSHHTQNLTSIAWVIYFPLGQVV
jgi:hypothetical protein